MCLSRVLRLLAQCCPPFVPSFSLSARTRIVSSLMRSSTNKVGFYTQSSHSSSLQLPFPAELVMKAFMIFWCWCGCWEFNEQIDTAAWDSEQITRYKSQIMHCGYLSPTGEVLLKGAARFKEKPREGTTVSDIREMATAEILWSPLWKPCPPLPVWSSRQTLRGAHNNRERGRKVTWVVMSDLSMEQQTCIFMPGHK